MAVTLLVLATYPSVILALITFLKSDLPLEQRILCPMYVCVMLTAPALAARVSTERLLGKMGKVGFLLLVVVYIPPLLVGLHHLATQGRGYTGPPYDAPSIYQFFRTREVKLFYTNDSSAAWLKVRGIGHGLPPGEARGPILYFRIGHPVPPRHEEAVKRPIAPPDDELQRTLEATPAHLVKKEGQVELYLPEGMANPF